MGHYPCPHVTRFTQGRLRARGSAQFMPAHRQLIGGNVLQAGGSHYRASLGPAWSDMVCMDFPSQRPHGSERACSGSPGVMTTSRARSVVRAEATGGWMVGGKVSTGTIHGPQCTCLTRLRAPAHSEEGGRWRCGAHRLGRRRWSLTVVKVSVLRVGVQLRALVKLLDQCTGRERRGEVARH
jgi:hypothetical protein